MNYRNEIKQVKLLCPFQTKKLSYKQNEWHPKILKRGKTEIGELSGDAPVVRVPSPRQM